MDDENKSDFFFECFGLDLIILHLTLSHDKAAQSLGEEGLWDMCENNRSNLLSQSYPFQVIPALIMKLLGKKKSKRSKVIMEYLWWKRQGNQWEIDVVKNRVEAVL